MTDKQLISRRLAMASEALDDARRLAEGGGSERSILNRAYYAMFHAVLSLANLKGFAPRKHQGAIAFFDKEFVHTGVFAKEMSADLHEAFDLRLEADYAELSEPTEREASATLEKAVRFTANVEAYVREQIGEGRSDEHS